MRSTKNSSPALLKYGAVYDMVVMVAGATISVWDGLTGVELCARRGPFIVLILKRRTTLIR
jgi:hypothetical protein